MKVPGGLNVSVAEEEAERQAQGLIEHFMSENPGSEQYVGTAHGFQLSGEANAPQSSESHCSLCRRVVPGIGRRSTRPDHTGPRENRQSGHIGRVHRELRCDIIPVRPDQEVMGRECRWNISFRRRSRETSDATQVSR